MTPSLPAASKARFDHETWRYRGNGAVDLVRDVDFDPATYADRGVVLYGNQDTNAAWSRVLDDVVQLRRDRVKIGDREVVGDELALLAVRPRKDSATACVAIVGGTGLTGCRVTDHRSYFVSGVGYPDWTVLDASSLTEGVTGIRGAGFFAADWSVGESAWR